MKLLWQILARRVRLIIRPKDRTIPTYCELIAREQLRILRRNAHSLERQINQSAIQRREKSVQFGLNYPTIFRGVEGE